MSKPIKSVLCLTNGGEIITLFQRKDIWEIDFNILKMKVIIKQIALFAIVSLLLLLLIGGCASTKKIMDSWLGMSKVELYKKWGPPNQITTDGNGGEILIYQKNIQSGQLPGRIYSNPAGGINYTNPTQYGYTQTRMFYVNKRGIIYHWRAEGI